MERKHISRRVFLQLAGTGLAGSIIAACAPSAPAPAEQPAQPAAQKPAATEAPKQAPAAPAGGKEYVMWGLQYDPHVDRYHALADAFEKKTGYKANIQPQAWPLETKLLAAITAGNPPDVVCVMGKVSTSLFQQKAVLEMDDVVYKAANVDPQKFFYPEAIQAYTWKGHYMGVPLESNQVSQSVGTRYDFLDEVGDKAWALWPGAKNAKSEPAGFDSYETMWELAKLLQKKDGNTVTRWGMSSQGWDYNQFFSLMYDLGKFFWDSGNQKFVIDSAEGVKAMQYYAETPVKMGIETQLDMTHMDALFAGKVGVAKGNTALAPEGAKLKLTDGTQMKVESVMSPSAVKGQEAKFVGEGGWGFEIPTRAKNKDIAVEFCKWMSTREGQVIYAQIYGGVVPATSVVLDDAIYAGDDIVKLSRRRAIASLKNTVYMGNEWGGDMTGTDDPFTKVRQGSMTAQEAVKALQDVMTANYNKWKDATGGA